MMSKTDTERRNEKNPRCGFCGKVGPILEAVTFDTGKGFVMITIYCQHCRKIITVNVLPGGPGEEPPDQRLIIPPGGVN